MDIIVITLLLLLYIQFKKVGIFKDQLMVTVTEWDADSPYEL